MKLLIIINPVSGGINKDVFLEEVEEFCKDDNIDYTIFKTSEKDDTHRLKKVIDEFKPDKVASAGGDGTTLFTGISLLEYSIPMGIIPLGSANGMAIELNVNLDPISALKELVDSEFIRNLDLILVNGKYHCLHIGDVGINAQIVDQYSKDSNRGMITYAKYFAKEIFSKDLFDYEIEANGKIYNGKTLMLAICNARKFGTGVPINRNGSPFDGKFELVLIDEVNSIKVLRATLSVFDEELIDDLESDIIVCEEATIKFRKKRLLQLDGEVIGEFDRLHLKILKGAIRYISHRNANFTS